MRILIADTDLTLLALVRRTLEAEGHQVRVASTAEAIQVAAADGRVDAAFVDATLAAMPEASADRLMSGGAHIFVTTALSDGHETIRALRARLGGADYLRKPFSVLDLPYELQRVSGGHTPSGFGGGYLLGRMAARGAAGPALGTRPPVERGNRSLMPRVGGPVVFPVAERIAGAWRERFTGSIQIRAEANTVSRPLQLLDGGLVDPRDTGLIETALQGAELQFAPGAAGLPGESGDRGRLIQTLWAAVYKPSEVRFAEVQAFEAVAKVPPDLLSELSRLVGHETFRVLDLADGARALGEVLVEAGTTPTTVSADMLGLHRLGLIQFAPPTTRSVDRRRVMTAGPSPASDRSPAPSKRMRRSSGSLRAARPSDSRSQRVSGRTQRGSNRLARASSGRGHVSESMRSFGRADAVHRRLEMELGRLEGASPAEVLGVPIDIDREMVMEVGTRMLERYRGIAANSRYDDDTRALASRIEQMVDLAIQGWGKDHTRATADPATLREEVMYEQAMVLVEAGDFARADRAFTAARDLAMANPKVLAGLGWSRFHNPQRPKEEREIEGRDYLMLAEQFDPRDADVVWLLCQVLEKMGEAEAALRRARRVVSVEPGHTKASRMVERLSKTDEAP
jgi:CheY-like chemotaxis protein